MKRRAVLVLMLITLAVAFGAVAGGAVGLLTQRTPEQVPETGGPGEDPSTQPDLTDIDAGDIPTDPSPSQPETTHVKPDTMLAWTPGGLPEGFADAVGRLQGVRRVVSVVSGIAWMTESRANDGTLIERPSRGLAIPVEVAAARLMDYAPFMPGAERVLLEPLARGAAVLGRTSSRLRSMPDGGTLRLGDIEVAVAGNLDDETIGAHEVFVSLRTARTLGISRERYLLIDPAEGVHRGVLERRIRGLVPPGTPLRIRGPGETPYFRHGDAVLAPARIKELFGEFAARPTGGFLDIDPEWEQRYIVTRRVPVLGDLRCHRDVIPQVRGALRELADRGLTHLVEDSAASGCFSARFANRDPTSSISHHSWGMAVDINVATNPLGATPQLDPRVVQTFERWGFRWGGDFLIPDGMHFEFLRFSRGN